ncbi:MAG: glycosyltransferase family 2 protein [Planctomycetes bacterium]|nr:glycosyltransferase family 2 protein [Planctomycetota bacterium]
MNDPSDRVDLSVVLPFRNERGNLPELLDRLRRTLNPTDLPYELVFVDDGSNDGGAEVLEQYARADRRIRVLVLSRNFGQHIAGSAGIDAARGEMIVWMDSDLQERPEDIPRLVDKHREGFDVVYARRTRRRQPPLRAWMSRTALTLLNWLSGQAVSPDRACLRLFSANVAEALRRCPERNRYMGYLMPWLGYRCAEIDIEADARRRGATNYSPSRLIRLALAGLTSFSTAPLRLAAVLSGATIAACLLGVSYVLYRYVAYGFVISGWASLIIALLLLHALQFAVLAVVGEYVGLTYAESKRRPLYLLARTVNSPADRAPSDPGAGSAGPIRGKAVSALGIHTAAGRFLSAGHRSPAARPAGAR